MELGFSKEGGGGGGRVAATEKEGASSRGDLSIRQGMLSPCRRLCQREFGSGVVMLGSTVQ